VLRLIAFVQSPGGNHLNAGSRSIIIRRQSITSEPYGTARKPLNTTKHMVVHLRWSFLVHDECGPNL
jgi:hypothetical protein